MESDRVCRSIQNNLILRKIVYYILSAFETLFAFRLIFKLLGVNPGNTFVSLIYTISGDFLTPFSGALSAPVNNGMETESILELYTMTAMVVYVLIAYAVIWLFEVYEIPKNRGIR